MERNYYDHKLRPVLADLHEAIQEAVGVRCERFCGMFGFGGLREPDLKGRDDAAKRGRLEKGQITPAQYRQQRDEIDRNLK